MVDGVVDWRLLVELCEAEVENPSVDSIEAIEATINKRKADARMNPIICMCSPLLVEYVEYLARKISKGSAKIAMWMSGCWTLLLQHWR